MGPVRRKAERRAPGTATERASETDLLGALLGVYRHLELSQQLRVLLEHAVAWSGASIGFAFGPGEDRRTLVPVAGTVPEQDPRYKALRAVDPAQLSSWLSGPGGHYEGLGPFAALAHSWPENPAGGSLGFQVQAEGGDTSGLLWLVFEQERGPVDTAKIQRLLDLAQPAIGNALHVQAVQELVIKDDTASCYNRRYFEEFLPEELSRASRFRAPLSLIFFDLDNLKQVNNEFGHAVGSRMLYEVSVRVRDKIRKFDKLFRFGGDEFCIVLPETEWHGALEVAERVRESVENNPFLANDPAIGGMPMTASFGIASFPLHARNKEDLIQLADRAMQRIKNSSKNAVGVAEIVGEEHGN